MSKSRALQEIESDAMRLVYRHLLGAIEASDWICVSNIAEQLEEIAKRGMYHVRADQIRDINRFAMGNYREPDPR